MYVNIRPCGMGKWGIGYTCMQTEGYQQSGIDIILYYYSHIMCSIKVLLILRTHSLECPVERHTDDIQQYK